MVEWGHPNTNYLRRPMARVSILKDKAFDLTIDRLCYQLIEHHGDLQDTILLGLQPRGVLLARRLKSELSKILKGPEVRCGDLDVTFHRDDFRRRDTPVTPNNTDITFDIEGKRVVLVDDVLYTGRTIRAGLDAMLHFGRPSEVQLLVLIDRRFSRELPVQPDHVGRWVDSIEDQRVAVEWKEMEGKDQVILFDKEE